MCFFNWTAHFKNVNNCLNTNIYYYLETSGGQNSNLYLNVVHFSTPVLIRHLWQHKTLVSLHWCLIRALLFPLTWETLGITAKEVIEGSTVVEQSTDFCEIKGSNPTARRKWEVKIQIRKWIRMITKIEFTTEI